MLPIANERGNFPEDPHKRDPLDFVLWQAEKPGEPSWESPWGKGRPGWHIECSTMATDLLGDTIDIHSGGGDLLFPHHECEIAQVEPLNEQKPFVRFWLHVAMVYHEGEKMSKSLGNLVWVRDLLKEYSADALRIYMGMHHYRESWSHNLRELNQASALDYEIRQALAIDNGKDGELDPTYYQETFHQALDNDLDTATALETVQEMVQTIINEGNSGKDIRRAQLVLRSFGNVFGLRMDNATPDPRVVQGWDQHLARFT
jgi:L-cysteine:1D-myo-inositol 2-amino-2-deoxy-alpha-D-glucopyranoside ligase